MYAKRRSLLAASLFVAALAACSSDSATGPNPALYGNWNCTNFLALGQDLIVDGGMTLQGTFTNTNTYTLALTGDLTGSCDPNPDCVVSGVYSATGSRLTFDPGTPGAITVNYSIAGDILTLSGNLNGVPATITLARL